MSWNMPDGASTDQYDRYMGYDQPDEDEEEIPEPYECGPDPELEAHWDEADEGDLRYSLEAERDDSIEELRRIPVVDLGAMLFQTAVAINRLHAAELRRPIDLARVTEDDMERALRYGHGDQEVA